MCEDVFEVARVGVLVSYPPLNSVNVSQWLE